MRNLKRALASILAVAMLSTSVNVGFAATANFSDVDSKYSTAVTRLAGIDILTGYEDGTFKPEGTITRAEAAAVMVRMLGKEKLASYSAGVSQFSDMTTSHWANGYVNVAASAGLVKGYEDGTFGPEKQVTYAEIVTMMVRAIGAGEAVGSAGTWPNNYLNFALTEGLTDDVAVVPNAPATRGDVAIMANQTLDTTMWEATGYNTDGTRTYAKTEGDNEKTLFTDKLELTKDEMYTVQTPLTVSDEDYSFTAGKDGDDANSTIDAGEISSFTFADGLDTPVYPGEEVDLLTNKDGDVVSIQHAKDSKQKVVPFVDVTDYSTSKIKVKLADDTEKSYNIVVSAPVYTNGGANTILEDKDMPGRLLINKDGKAERIFTYDYNNALVVKEVKYNETDNKYTIKADTELKNNDTSLTYDLDTTVVYVNNASGMTMKVADIKEGDMLLYSDNKAYVLVVPANSIEGTVDAEDADSVKIDGTEYNYSENFVGNTEVIENISVDDKVKAYLDVNDQIVTLEKVTAGSSASGSYGIITDFYRDETATKGKNTVRIDLFDLSSGTNTGVKVFDAENTDKEANTDADAALEEPVFAGADFYDELAATPNSTADGALSITFGTLAPVTDYADLLGKVVKYDIDSDKVTLYPVESNEIRLSDKEDDATAETATLDVSKGKYTTYDGSYYVEPDNVKVYQATEVDSDDNTLAIKSVDYSTLKDDLTVGKVAYLIDLDDKEEVAQYVYYPMANLGTNTKQDLLKVNDGSLGVVTRVREVTNEDVEFTVLTKDGSESIFVDKDDRSTIKSQPIKNDGEVDLSDANLPKFVGLLASFSADADGYVTNETISFTNALKVAKFQELNSMDEVKLLTASDTEDEKDAYSGMYVVEADVTASETAATQASATLTLGTLVDGNKVTVGTTDFTYDSAIVTPVVDTTWKTAADLAADINALPGVSATATDATTVVVKTDLKGLASNDTVAIAVTANVTLTGDNAGKLAGAVDTSVTPTSVVFDDMGVSDISEISEVDDEEMDYTQADISEASTVYYYLVEVDEDGELVDLVPGATNAAVAVMFFDPNETFTQE